SIFICMLLLIVPVQCGDNLCRACVSNNIAVSQFGKGAKQMDRDFIESKIGSCATRTFSCIGRNSNIEINNGKGVVTDGDDGVLDGKTTMQLNCHMSGVWVYKGITINAVQCSTAGPSTCVDDVNPLSGVSNCAFRVGSCKLKKFEAEMRRDCPKTCGFC
ncbi:hypothetical protein PENTCL1PPCAC_29034, partial [Pristionchus entomophagus]